MKCSSANICNLHAGKCWQMVSRKRVTGQQLCGLLLRQVLCGFIVDVQQCPVMCPVGGGPGVWAAVSVALQAAWFTLLPVKHSGFQWRTLSGLLLFIVFMDGVSQCRREAQGAGFSRIQCLNCSR